MRIAVLSLVLVLGCASAVRAGIIDDCLQNADPKLKISSCSRMIEIGKLELDNTGVLAKSYTAHGIDLAELGIHERAVKKFDAAINLDPENPYLYFKRGLANLGLGDLKMALTDWRRAVVLDRGEVVGVIVAFTIMFCIVLSFLLWIYHWITHILSQIYSLIISILSRIERFLRAMQQAVTKAKWYIRRWVSLDGGSE